MFDVDRKGLSELLMNEEPSRFAFELIQNCWDEDDVTRVDVTLEPVKGRKLVKLVVEDDSPNGFADLADAYTLFKASYKKGIADKRGRFNLGEKIVIAVAHKAVIETTTGTVTFDKGERSRSRKRTKQGSRVTVFMPWTRDQMQEVIGNLNQLIPPTRIETVVNGRLIGYRTPIDKTNACLQTVLEREDGTIGTTFRHADIEVYDLHEYEEGGIYEMGIPVVTTGDPWHMNICQKVPLTIDRKNVPPAFLRDVRGQALNIMAEHLTPETAQEKWADDALESGEADEVAINALMTNRYGEKRVSYDPSDPEANNLAVAKGYTVVHGGNMSKRAWRNVKDAGAMNPAGKVTPSNSKVHTDPDGVPPMSAEDWTTEMRKFEAYAKSFANRILDAEIVVDFYLMGLGANWAMAYKKGLLVVNMSAGLTKDTLGSVNQYKWDKILIHEFGHHMEENHLADDYHDALCHIGAKLHTTSIYP